VGGFWEEPKWQKEPCVQRGAFDVLTKVINFHIEEDVEGSRWTDQRRKTGSTLGGSKIGETGELFKKNKTAAGLDIRPPELGTPSLFWNQAEFSEWGREEI